MGLLAALRRALIGLSRLDKRPEVAVWDKTDRIARIKNNHVGGLTLSDSNRFGAITRDTNDAQVWLHLDQQA